LRLIISGFSGSSCTHCQLRPLLSTNLLEASFTLEFEIMSQESIGVKTGKQNGDQLGESFFGTFSAEPALLLQRLSTILVYVVVQDFLTEKVCLVNLGYSEEVCNALQSGR